MQNERNQNKIFIIGFSLITLVILWFFLKPLVLNWKDRQKNLEEQKANAEILKAPSILSDDVFQMIQKKSKLILVDISAPEDFKKGHIATAENISDQQLDKNYFKTRGDNETADIVIMNQGSDLASLASLVNKIVSAGFVNTKYMRGGISDWKEKGYPLVSSGGADADNAKVKKITIDEIKKESENDPTLFQFLDVRGKEAYIADHIVGAINIPLTELEARKSEVPAANKTIVYGANANESFQAAVTLFDLNFFNIYQMESGIDEWKAAKGNTESGN